MNAARVLSNKKIIILLLAVYTSMQVFCINNLTLNYDEGSFATYGISLLKLERKKDILLYESKLPITALNMLPRAVEQLFSPRLKKTWQEAQQDVVHGRYISLLISILLGLLILKWSRELYDEKTALLVFLFYLLSPGFLAHGIFVSSDIYACFFMTAALYFLWRFFLQQEATYFVLMSLATAFAEISKFSMAHLIIVLFITAGACHFHGKNSGIAFLNRRKIIVYTAVFFFINWFVVCAAHLFYQVFLPIRDYSFMSLPFKNLQNVFTRFFPGFPIPLPSSYIESMDAVLYFDQLGGGVQGSLNGQPYILGQHSISGFWYYYFVAMFFKTPLPTLLLWTLSLFLLFKKYHRHLFFSKYIFLVTPVLYFLIYMNFFYSTQVGVRHIAIIFPCLFVLSGTFISALLKKKQQTLLYCLLTYQAISVFLYFPQFLPYTNEFILNKKLAYRKIADTNLCYGEGRNYLTTYLRKHKDAIYLPKEPVAGKVVMEVNELLDLNISTVHKYNWAQCLTPVDHIHSQYLVFDVNQKTVDSLKQINNK